MKKFKAIYYPNAECPPLTLAKAILVFDELTFYDHTSIMFQNVGTVGHDSHMRHFAHQLGDEGYNLSVVKPAGGQIVDEIRELIDADLQNSKYRQTFFNLIQNDPSFLMSKVKDGNYGVFGDADEYRRRILALKPDEIPQNVSDLEKWRVGKDGGIPPEMNIALTMALDSFNFNFSAYMSIEEDLHMLGDSEAMDMLLKTKFADKELEKAADKGISEAVAFSMLEHVIPKEAFIGKRFEDIVRFRNDTFQERERFKEKVLEQTIELQDLSGAEKYKAIDKVIYKGLLPEFRSYQESQLQNWDTFFSQSTKSILYSAKDISAHVVQTLPLSLAAGLLTAATHIGLTVLPHLIDYLQSKKQLDRTNPYAYLMKFN
jgi:hypothetical protein